MNDSKKYNQLPTLLVSHLKEILREPGVLFWGILFPILMSLALGIAFTRKQDTLRKVAVLKGESNSNVREILKTYADSTGEYSYQLTIRNEKMGNTFMRFYMMEPDEAMVALKRGLVNVIVAENEGEIEYRFDPMNPDAQLNYLKLSKYFGKGENVVIENTANISPMTLRGTRYIDFLIPGLLAMGVMMSTMWGISYGIIEKRSKKLLRRMVATPMSKSSFLVSFMTIRMMMNFVEALLLVLFAWLVFHISIQGSIPALLTIFIAGNIGFSGLAFFISSRTTKTEIGNGLINVVVMPMMILSGIFFSYHNFPEGMIPFIRQLPLTLVADGMRSIFIEGAGFQQIMLPSVILFAGGIIFFTAGLKMFRWY